jgi:hypothetical protein
MPSLQQYYRQSRGSAPEGKAAMALRRSTVTREDMVMIPITLQEMRNMH